MWAKNPSPKKEVREVFDEHLQIHQALYAASIEQRKEQARNMSAQSSQTTHEASQAAEPTGAGVGTEVACVFHQIRLTKTQHTVMLNAIAQYNFQLAEYFPPDQDRLQAARDLEKIFSL